MLAFIAPEYLLSQGAWEKEMRVRGLDPKAGDWGIPEKRLAAICERLGIDFVDPTEQFRAAGVRLHFRADPHFNEKGQALMADAVEQYFRTRWGG